MHRADGSGQRIEYAKNPMAGGQNQLGLLRVRPNSRRARANWKRICGESGGQVAAGKGAGGPGMSPVTLAWSAAWILMGAAAVNRLLRLSNNPEPFVRSAYRMLAVAAACLAAGGIVQQAANGVIGGPQPLRIADLISLAALPALIIGLATITADRVRTADGTLETSRWRRDGAQAWPQPGAVLDSALFVVALFTIALATLFGPAYSGSGMGPAAFVVDLIRPAADLLALGLVVLLASRSPRLVALPALALFAVTIGDCLAVGARISGVDSGADIRRSRPGWPGWDAALDAGRRLDRAGPDRGADYGRGGGCRRRRHRGVQPREGDSGRGRRWSGHRAVARVQAGLGDQARIERLRLGADLGLGVPYARGLHQRHRADLRRRGYDRVHQSGGRPPRLRADPAHRYAAGRRSTPRGPAGRDRGHADRAAARLGHRYLPRPGQGRRRLVAPGLGESVEIRSAG